VHEITTESIVFYGSCWAVAFFACLSRSRRDVSNFDFWNIIASCGMAGFLAFGVIGFLVDGNRDPGGVVGHGYWYYLALAALLGLVSKDPDKIAWMILSKALGAIRAALPPEDKKDKEQNE
jgi:hypothetical protein